MKVVLYGASGMIGRRILNELIARGHQVVAVVRDPSKLAGVAATVETGDVLSPTSIVETAIGTEAVISAYAPPLANPSNLIDATVALIASLPLAAISRFLMVGGAGNLTVAPGVQLIDAPSFPAEWKSIAKAHADALEILKNSDLDWTTLSPAALIEPGERTGTFRLGLDELISDPSGQSRISAEDYAVALVDELESPKHIRQRFTVGY